MRVLRCGEMKVDLVSAVDVSNLGVVEAAMCLYPYFLSASAFSWILRESQRAALKWNHIT